MQLKNLIVESRLVDVEFPGLEGFIVKVSHIGKETLMNMRTKCVSKKFNRKTRQPEEDFDLELFNELFVEAAVKGWSGLKYKHLEDLIVVDISELDAEDELEFSIENAVLLIKHSSHFDTWISEVISDLDTFRTKSKSATV
jgi:hypothetical protein